MGHARLEFDAELRFFLAPAARDGTLLAPLDGTSSLGHVVESVGVPLPEVGELLVTGPLDTDPRSADPRSASPRSADPLDTDPLDTGPLGAGPLGAGPLGAGPLGAGRPVPSSYRPADGDVVRVRAVRRPQRLPAGPPRFTLDVHLGKLARRLRLVGVDTDYHNDIDDDVLVELANREERVLLTQDRGLLHRRRLWFGAYVRGVRPEEQFRDVLDRFAPPLAPWTRCTACNGVLAPVAKETIEHLLQPGTRRTYDGYARCEACGRLYWKGAHHRRLQAIVDAALDPS